jgi:predicted ATPase
VEPDDPDGVADLLAVTVAEALAVPLAARRPARELLGAWLAERRLLVVLDNLEHLPGAASLVTELLAAAPGLKLLATSRRRVGAGVEWVLDVPGLGEGPAVELFAERARRVRAGFSLEDEGPAVAAICRLVEGLPLAIELAADLARTLPCQVIADKLVSDPDLLTTTSATVPPRHRSMRSVIEASWRLLDAGQQRALARLSVFRGGFDPAAAEAVAGADPAMLSALVERSLVDRAGGGRYGLHELLRQFAAERLEAAGDAAATRRAHAGHYAGFLAARHDRLADALDTAVLAEVDPETANLRAAWQELAETGGIDAVAGLLEDLWLVHRRHGRFQEALGMLQRALARDDATPGSGPGGTCGPGSPSTSWGGPRRARRSCGPCSAWPAGPCRRPAPAGPRPLLGAPPARPAAGPSGPGRPPTRTPGRRRPRSPKPTP